MAFLRLILAGAGLGVVLFIVQSALLHTSTQVAFDLDLIQPGKISLGVPFNATCAIANFDPTNKQLYVGFALKTLNNGFQSQWGIGIYMVVPNKSGSQWLHPAFPIGYTLPNERYRTFPTFDAQVQINVRQDKYEFSCVIMSVDVSDRTKIEKFYSNDVIVTV